MPYSVVCVCVCVMKVVYTKQCGVCVGNKGYLFSALWCAWVIKVIYTPQCGVYVGNQGYLFS